MSVIAMGTLSKACVQSQGHEVVQKMLITGISDNECFKRVECALLMSMSNKAASG